MWPRPVVSCTVQTRHPASEAKLEVTGIRNTKTSRSTCCRQHHLPCFATRDGGPRLGWRSHLPCSHRAPQVSGRPWPAGLLGRFPGGLLLRLQHATPVVVNNATDGCDRQRRNQQIKSLKARDSNQLVLKEQRELPTRPDKCMRNCDSGCETHHRQQERQPVRL
jgi:hypothetical protein